MKKFSLLLLVLSFVGLSISGCKSIPEPVDDIVQIEDLQGKWQAIYESTEWPPTLTTVPDSLGFLFHEFDQDTVNTWFTSASGIYDTPVYTSQVSVDSLLGPYQAVLKFNPYSYTSGGTTTLLGTFSAPFYLWIELDPGRSFTVIRHPTGDTIPRIKYLLID